MSPNLEISYFLDADADSRRGGHAKNRRVSRRDERREIDAAAVVVGGGTNVVPNHHHDHRRPGVSPPIRFQGGTVWTASGVTAHA